MKKAIALFTAFAIVCALSGTAVLAAKESDVTSMAQWASRTEIHNKLGEPQDMSLSGYKEIYKLSDGKTAVIRYLDNMLESGYILVN